MAAREGLNVRESVLRGENHKLLHDSWGEWYTIMSLNPLEPGSWVQRSDEEGKPGTGYKNVKALKDTSKLCGIYELRIMKDTKTVVVYVGSSCCGTGKGVRSRLKGYATNGSHKRAFINAALIEGAIIQARVKVNDECTKEQSGEWENELLAKYDYLWNVRRNWTERKRAIYTKAFVSDILKG